MDVHPCNCTPEVPNPSFRAFIGTGGICIYSPGETIQHALENVYQHAKKDKIPKSKWAEIWVEDLKGKLVAEVTKDGLKIYPGWENNETENSDNAS